MKSKLVIGLVFFSATLFGQVETPKEKIKRLANEIENLVKEEKTALKLTYESLENRQKSGELTKDQVTAIKTQEAEASAARIGEIVTERSNLISELTNQIVKDALEEVEVEVKDTTGKKTTHIKIQIGPDKKSSSKRTKDRMVFAIGLNNVLVDNRLTSLDDSPYSVWKSNFVELGWGYKTALNKENRVVNLFYGLSFQWNELKLFDNLYHIDTNGETLVVEHPENLKKSKLRNTQLIVPLGFEFDFSNKKTDKGTFYSDGNRGFRIGIGGYAGLRVNSKQIIKYEKPYEQRKEKLTDDYNFNNLTYGITSYIGYKDTSLYLKYDLHPLFKDSNLNNVSLGVRFDW